MTRSISSVRSHWIWKRGGENALISSSDSADWSSSANAIEALLTSFEVPLACVDRPRERVEHEEHQYLVAQDAAELLESKPEDVGDASPLLLLLLLEAEHAHRPGGPGRSRPE